MEAAMLELSASEPRERLGAFVEGGAAAGASASTLEREAAPFLLTSFLGWRLRPRCSASIGVRTRRG
jgi:hypothetical protein